MKNIQQSFHEKLPKIISMTKKDLAPALIDNRGLAEGGVDTGEERAVAHWRVATKEHLTLGWWEFDRLGVDIQGGF